MEEEERENVESVSIGGFAEKIARDLIKETISETNSVKIWSIPCSSGCHNHSKQEGSNGHSSGGSLCWITETSEQDPEPSSSGTCSALSAETCSVKPTSFSDPRDKLNLTCSPSPRECLESEPCKEDRPPSTNSHPGDGTDLVHRRLKVRDQHNQQEAAGASGSAGHGAEAGAGEKEEEKFEFRNKSEENLVSIHRNGKKQSLRKGLSVNDISETSSSNLPGGKASSKINLLKTLGLKKPKDEVTQRLSDGEDKVGGGNKMKAIKKTLTNIFHFKHRETEPGEKKTSRFKIPSKRNKSCPPCKRALPPVPAVRLDSRTPSPLSDLNLEDGEVGWVGGVAPEPTQPVAPEDESQMDFAASIEKVKDHGWYWGPLSGETAERILAPEPDGSFVVRDSSDHHYIFSLTFKLNGFVRHVRIEHDQGNFSFGSFTKFKSNTIVDFIENAVEHSRSGRYLFFLHRRPVLGPMRVQLLHPVSRFKRVQSLQHLCRYVIVKHVRRDHLDDLPVPNRIKQYLNTPFYYSEQVEEEEEEDALQQQLADRENADILDFQPDLDHPMLELDTQDRTSNQEQDLVSEPENLEHNRAEALSSVEYPDTLISPAPGAVSNPATSSSYPGSSLLSSPHPNRSSTPQNF